MPQTRKTHIWVFTFLLFCSLYQIASPSFARGQRIQMKSVVVSKDFGLVWQREESEPVAWETAVNYCEKLNIGLSSRWRLPNVKELRSLVNEGTHNPAADTGKFPEMHSAPYWTSTTYVSSTYSYCVNFTAGVVGYCKKNQKKYVRCVTNL